MKKVKFNSWDVRHTKDEIEIAGFFPNLPAYRVGEVVEYYDMDNKTSFSRRVEKVEIVNGPGTYNQKVSFRLIHTQVSQQLELF